MVQIIIFGLVIGVILACIPSTGKLGFYVLSGVGVIFLITAGVLLLGQLFVFLLPVLIIGGVIYGTYYLAVNKGKPKKQSNEKTPHEGKVNLLMRDELFSNNDKYNKWVQNILSPASMYQRLLSILQIEQKILGSYNKASELVTSLQSLQREFNDITNKYKPVLGFNNYVATITDEQLKDIVLANNLKVNLENAVTVQNEIFASMKNFEYLVENTYKSMVETFIDEGLKGKKLFIFGEYRMRGGYENLDIMLEDSLPSLLKAYKLLSSQVEMNKEFAISITLIEEVLEQFNKLKVNIDEDDIEKVKAIIYLAYANNAVATHIEKARDTAISKLYKTIDTMKSNELIKFVDFEESVIGEGAYFKKRYERWTETERGSIYSFRVQYKEYIIYIVDGFIVKVEKGNIEE